ncbi:MAG TPA: Rpn family recombination-promoting nuclease/putative transposase [Gemmataceae bacterium]|nr:Rpn family recombination-promoting nuclease/putative transposase [Gemmataceae bacterium]
MKRSWQKEMVRRFPENGVKLLLENRLNVRDLFFLTEQEIVTLIDFLRLKLVRGTFVGRDYRHVESDIVLTAPYRPEGVLRRLWLYLLIEHQSEPDPLMPLRLLEYVVQIFKMQQREWLKGHRSLAGLRLQPVLPLVFYTGTERWESIGDVIDLIEHGAPFRDVTPVMKPLFVNLPALPPGRLESGGGSFGQVMRLVRGRNLPAEQFGSLLEQVTTALEAMPAAERMRRQELLSYLYALVYHERQEPEHQAFHERIEEAAQTGPFRGDLTAMRQTIADMLKAEGRKEGELRTRREVLLRLLRNRFGELPAPAERRVKAARDVAQLREWFDRASTAATLEDVGIAP